MKKKSTKSTTTSGRRKTVARKSGTKRLARSKRLSGHKIVDSIIDYFTRHPREVVNYKAVAASLGFTTMSEKQFVVRTLESLVEQGMLTQVEIGRYRYQVGAEMLEGVFESRRNYCVVVPDDKSAEVIISDRNNPEHALAGDRVRVALFPLKARRTRTGQVVEVLQRRCSTYVGRVVVTKGFPICIPRIVLSIAASCSPESRWQGLKTTIRPLSELRIGGHENPSLRVKW